jgi:hypothetical protein
VRLRAVSGKSGTRALKDQNPRSDEGFGLNSGGGEI